MMTDLILAITGAALFLSGFAAGSGMSLRWLRRGRSQ
jgi:hypothetical protein